MKLSGMPEKAYDSRPSEFGGLWHCACIRAIPTYVGASIDVLIPQHVVLEYMYSQLPYKCEFGSFEKVLYDVRIHAMASTDTMILWGTGG